MNSTGPTAKSTLTGDHCPSIRIRLGTDTRPGIGKATPWSSEKSARVVLRGCDQRQGRKGELELRAAKPRYLDAPGLDPGFVETRRPHQSGWRSGSQLPGHRHRQL